MDPEASDRDQAEQFWKDEAIGERIRARRLRRPREEDPQRQRPPLQICQEPSTAKSKQGLRV